MRSLKRRKALNTQQTKTNQSQLWFLKSKEDLAYSRDRSKVFLTISQKKITSALCLAIAAQKILNWSVVKEQRGGSNKLKRDRSWTSISRHMKKNTIAFSLTHKTPKIKLNTPSNQLSRSKKTLTGHSLFTGTSGKEKLGTTAYLTSSR